MYNFNYLWYRVEYYDENNEDMEDCKVFIIWNKLGCELICKELGMESCLLSCGFLKDCVLDIVGKWKIVLK